jgi:hypothetical protein
MKGEMMANDFETVVKIEPMSIMALGSTVQMDLITFCFFGFIDHPF